MYLLCKFFEYVRVEEWVVCMKIFVGKDDYYPAICA